MIETFLRRVIASLQTLLSYLTHNNQMIESDKALLVLERTLILIDCTPGPVVL